MNETLNQINIKKSTSLLGSSQFLPRESTSDLHIGLRVRGSPESKVPIVLCLVLQSVPTHVNELAGYSEIAPFT